MIAGIVIGVLNGIVTGLVTLLLWQTSLNIASGSAIKVTSVLTITAEILALPSFWFGGPWLATKILDQILLVDMVSYYLVTLCLVYVVFVSVPLAKWVRSL